MRHLSTLHLHQLRYGELPPDREPAARRHLADCPQCAGRLAVQERERRAFEVLPVPVALRPPAPKRSRGWLFGLIGTLAAVAAAAALTIAAPGIFGPETDGPSVRVKGAASAGLEVWVERTDGTRPWRPGEVLRAGDRVQLVVAPEGAATITVGGRDGTGVVEVYGSYRPDDPRRPSPAPFSLTLDAAPGPQEFFAVRAAHALSDDEVKLAVSGDVPPRGVTVATIAIPKE